MSDKNYMSNIENFNLENAVDYVIEQNKDVGYMPTRFIQIAQKGVAEKNLDKIISNLILNAELLEELEKVIKRYPYLITIEDLITTKKDHFKLPDDVVRQAKGRAEYFSNMRIQISNIK